jgi:hypothetical protein
METTMANDPKAKTRSHDVEAEDQQLDDQEERDLDEPEPLDAIVEGEILDEDDEIIEREKEDE